MTQLRRMMLEELQRRNYSAETVRQYLRAVAQFAKHFGKRPDQLGPDELRSYQAYLLRERKLAVGSVVAQVAALRFFYVRTLKRHQFREDLPYPKDRRRLPTVLSLEEVTRLIHAAGDLLQRALLMTLYGTRALRHPSTTLPAQIRFVTFPNVPVREAAAAMRRPAALPSVAIPRATTGAREVVAHGFRPSTAIYPSGCQH